ncbi:unnamed protein product [Effrenium voratum]|nr:unnamed protein product [Effrenium voratum]
MEPALGGELYATYNRKGLHGSEKHTKFYIAGTVCALAHLHERRIIYRDLKPENLLLSEGGQLKLTDMGLAKFVVGKTYTTCGTPDYFSPELIASSGHTIAVDWWTLGILLFELMAGHPPFESPTPMETYSKVMKGIGKVKMPPKCQGAIGDLIKGLLKKEPSERLPMRPGSTQNLKDHKRLGDVCHLCPRTPANEMREEAEAKKSSSLADFFPVPSGFRPFVLSFWVLGSPLASGGFVREQSGCSAKYAQANLWAKFGAKCLVCFAT